MRFRRRTKLFPGVYLNFSKSGISTTVGVPGASINFGKQGAFLNTGIPGTGIYDRKKISGGRKGQQDIPSTDTDTPTENYSREEFGEIKLTSSTGLNESYSLSSFDKSGKFANAMIEYQKTIK